MTRSGLVPLEVAVLRALPPSTARRARTSRVLAGLEDLGPAYALAVLHGLGVAWRVHLPLVDAYGNWGTVLGDPPSDARYTRVRRSAVGDLVVAAEDGALGPVPVGLVEGSLHRGGAVPPFAPHAVVAALTALWDEPGLRDRELVRRVGEPAFPTGGTVAGRLDSLLAGRRTRLQLGCRTVREDGRLVVTGTPPGVPVDELVRHLEHRGRPPRADAARPPTDRLVDVRDETTERGTRIVLTPAPGTDLDELQAWAVTVWPATVEVDARLPAPLPALLRDWVDGCAGDRSGLDAYAALL